MVETTNSPVPTPTVTLYDKNSREEEAELSLKCTSFTRGVPTALVILFLLTICIEPIMQHVIEIRRNVAIRQQEARELGAVQTKLLPQMYDVVTLLPSFERADKPADATKPAPKGFWRYWSSMATVREIEGFDDALEKDSISGQWVLPRMQQFLTGVLGAGNEQAYCGTNGWLYYRPDLEYLIGHPFLDPQVLKQRARSGDSSTTPVQPDPIKAIVHFKQQLAERGIALVVMPMPMKPVIQPENLSSRYSLTQAPLQNPSYATFVTALEAQGIPVCDVSTLLASDKQQSGKPQFLKTDTHWTPTAMELAAQYTVKFVQDLHVLPSMEPYGYTQQAATVTNLGDIAIMLKLPKSQTIYKPETVQIHQVYGPDGELWTPDSQADVLVLGDSFTNIFSLQDMGWGESAGFAEQLSFFLQRPVDLIAQNAGGSFASRQELAKKLIRGAARGEDLLAGKRVVIYEFAMRDLSSGDWKIIDLPKPAGQ